MNNSMAAKQKEIVDQTSGEEMQMQVEFREVDPFNLWVSQHCKHLHFVTVPYSVCVAQHATYHFDLCNLQLSAASTAAQYLKARRHQ